MADPCISMIFFLEFTSYANCLPQRLNMFRQINTLRKFNRYIQNASLVSLTALIGYFLDLTPTLCLNRSVRDLFWSCANIKTTIFSLCLFQCPADWTQWSWRLNLKPNNAFIQHLGVTCSQHIHSDCTVQEQNKSQSVHHRKATTQMSLNRSFI